MILFQMWNLKKKKRNEWEFYPGALKAKYKRKLEEVKYFTLKDSLFYFYVKVISCLTFFQFTDNTIFLDVLKHIFTHHFSSITSAVLRHHFNFIQEKEAKLTWSARSCHSVLEKLNENSRRKRNENLSFSSRKLKIFNYQQWNNTHFSQYLNIR